MLTIKQTTSLVAGLALFYASFAVVAPQSHAAEAAMNTNASMSSGMSDSASMEKSSMWSRMFNRNGASSNTEATQPMMMNKNAGMMHSNHGMHSGMGSDKGMMHHGGMGHESYFEKVAEDWKATIGLTPEQQKKLNSLEMDYKAETDAMEMEISKLKQDMMSYLGSTNLDEGELNTKIDTLSDAKRDLMKKRVNFYFEVEDFLTKEQVTKSRQFWSSHMSESANKMNHMSNTGTQGGTMKPMQMQMMKKSSSQESSVNLGFQAQELPINSSFQK